jgi:hypothetical protein
MWTFGQELHDSDFGKREEIYRIKKQKRKSDLTAISVAPCDQ